MPTITWLGSVMHIGFSKIRVKREIVLRVFGDHMMAHKRPSLSSVQYCTVYAWVCTRVRVTVNMTRTHINFKAIIRERLIRILNMSSMYACTYTMCAVGL